MPAAYLPAVSVPRLVYPFQLVVGYPVASNGGTAVPIITGPSTQGWSFPMQVPASRWFVVTNIHFASKYGAMGRSSYFCLDGLITITDVTQSWSCGHPSQGLLIPPGGTLGGAFWNNEQINESGALNGELGNMQALIRGFMVDHQVGMSWFTALHGINFDNFAHPGELMAG